MANTKPELTPKDVQQLLSNLDASWQTLPNKFNEAERIFNADLALRVETVEGRTEEYEVGVLSSVNTDEIGSLVYSILALYLVIYLKQRPYFEVFSNLPDEAGNANKQRDFLDHLLNQIPRFKIKLMFSWLDALVKGLGVSKAWFKRIPMGKRDLYYIEWDYVDPRHMRFPLEYKTFDQLPYIMQYVIIPKHDLLKRVEDGIYPRRNVNRWIKQIQKGENAEKLFEDYKILEVWIDGDLYTFGCAEDTPVELLRYEPKILGRNDFYLPHPYVFWRDLPTSTLVSKGIPHREAHLQASLNTFLNALLDYLRRLIFPPLLYEETALPDEEAIYSLYYDPYPVVPVRDVNSFKWLELPVIDARFFNIIERLRFTMQDREGIYDVLMGAPPPRKSTATEQLLRQQHSLTRQEIRQSLIEMGLKELGTKTLLLGNMFVSETYTFLTAQHEEVEFQPEDPSIIEHKYIVVPRLSTMAGERTLARQQWLELIQIASQLPIAPRIKWDAIFKILIEEGFGISDVNLILSETPQTPVAPVGGKVPPTPATPGDMMRQRLGRLLGEAS